MRIFQNFGLMPAYRKRLDKLAAGQVGFNGRLECFLHDRYGAMHLLLPVHRREPEAFFTNGDDDILQRSWAREHGMSSSASLDDILLAQIEDHRTEVFYNVDPFRFGTQFLRRLPGTVKRKIAWRAAPSQGADFSGYDLMICNFHSILEDFRKNGLRAAWFSPSHDPELDTYAANRDRPIDIAFIGTYSRHHRRRAALIEAIASISSHVSVALHLDTSSRFLRLAETPLGLIGPLRQYRRPQLVRAASHAPVFGRDLYQVLSSAKIIVNGAIDMAGQDRGNMRCWEAMGAGALLVSDEGIYPKGMVDGETMMTYQDTDSVIAIIQKTLADPALREETSNKGHQMLSKVYSKGEQYSSFLKLV